MYIRTGLKFTCWFSYSLLARFSFGKKADLGFVLGCFALCCVAISLCWSCTTNCSWDLICISSLYLSQVSEYLSCVPCIQLHVYITTCVSCDRVNVLNSACDVYACTCVLL